MSSKNSSATKKLLGKNVKYFRYKNNLTQEKLAERCDLSPRYISDIENGNGNISIDTLTKLSEILNVKTYDWLKPRNIKELPQRINMR